MILNKPYPFLTDKEFQISKDKLRKKILTKNPKTLDDYFDIYLKLYDPYYEEKYVEFGCILLEMGFKLTSCYVRDRLCDQVLKRSWDDFQSFLQ